MINDDAAPIEPPLPPRMPAGHPANLLRAEIASAQPRHHRLYLIECWWTQFGDAYSVIAKESADAADECRARQSRDRRAGRA